MHRRTTYTLVIQHYELSDTSHHFSAAMLFCNTLVLHKEPTV